MIYAGETLFIIVLSWISKKVFKTVHLHNKDTGISKAKNLAKRTDHYSKF